MLYKLVFNSFNFLSKLISLDPSKHDHIKKNKSAAISEPWFRSFAWAENKTMSFLVRNVLVEAVVVVSISPVASNEPRFLDFIVMVSKRGHGNKFVSSKSSQL